MAFENFGLLPVLLDIPELIVLIVFPTRHVGFCANLLLPAFRGKRERDRVRLAIVDSWCLLAGSLAQSFNSGRRPARDPRRCEDTLRLTARHRRRRRNIVSCGRARLWRPCIFAL